MDPKHDFREMLREALAATWLAVAPPPGLSPTLAWVGLGLLGVIWLSTMVFQIPAHRRLEAGLDPATVTRLVRTNWIRALGWTARSGLVLFTMAQATSGA